MKFITKSIHAGQKPDVATGATVVPIYQSSTFTFDSFGVNKGYEYTRAGNPTRTALEECVAALENGKYGIAFASGLAAETAILSVLNSGQHVVSMQRIYGGTFRLFEDFFAPRGLQFDYVESLEAKDFEAMIKPETKMIWLETPTNPTLSVVDIEAIVKIAKPKGIWVVVDNTFASPYLQQPLELGADIVIHSTTKYMGGHSDVIGGAAIVNDDFLAEKIHFFQNALGGVPSPFDCWLVLRGLKTLALRMQQHSSNALKIAEILTTHKAVNKVYYPGLPQHPQHQIAKKQMKAFGGMVTIELKGGLPEVETFLKNLKIFALAESLGGVESLANHSATMTHASVPEKMRIDSGITDTVIRLSIGIEDVEDLILDLQRALNSI